MYNTFIPQMRKVGCLNYQGGSILLQKLSLEAGMKHPGMSDVKVGKSSYDNRKWELLAEILYGKI